MMEDICGVGGWAEGNLACLIQKAFEAVFGEIFGSILLILMLAVSLWSFRNFIGTDDGL